MKVWDFVERFYPDYPTSNRIGYADDLRKIVDEEEEPGDDASSILFEEFNGDRRKAKRKLLEVEHELYERAIINYLKQEERL